MAVNSFEDTFDLEDFTTPTDTSVGPEEFSTVERLEVEKGEGVMLGQGRARSQTDAVGRIYADPNNSTSTLLSGKIRFAVLNSQLNKVAVISQHTIGTVNTGQNTRGDRRPYWIRPFRIMEPYSLGVQIKLASGTDTYSSGDSTLEVDGIRMEKSN